MFGERDRLEPALQFCDGQVHEVDDAASAYLHVAGLGAESCAVTLGAHGLAPIAGQHHAVLNLVLSLAQVLEEGVYRDEAPLLFLGAQTALFGCERVGEGAVPEPVLLLTAQLEVGLVDGEAPFGIEADEPLLPFAHLLAAPAHHRPLVDRQRRVGDDQVFIDADDASESLALGAGSGRGVEGEQFVGGFLKGDAVGLEPHAERVQDAGRVEAEHHLAAPLVEGRFCGVHQTGNDVLFVAYRHAVDDQV